MSRFAAVLVMVCAAAAWSAEATRVASSFETDDPFGMFLNFSFDRVQDRAKIVREWYQRGTSEDVTELRYQKFSSTLGIDLHLGIFRDLELHVGVPIVFQQDRYWSFAKDTGDANTTIYRNCVDARGGVCPTPGLGTGHLFTVGDPSTGEPSGAFRGGLGDVSFGLAWAPFSQAKDDTKPTWVLRFEYTAPTAAMLNPSLPTSLSDRGSLGDKMHRYTWSTAVSKRLSVAEPYFELHYTLPWRGPGFYSNCDKPSEPAAVAAWDARMGRSENCMRDVWDKDETGLRPPHTGGFFFGTEATLYERPERHQRFVIDLRGFANYVSEGRYNNELSDLMGKLLYTTDYAQVGGHFGFVGQAAEFVVLRAYASWAYNTEHFLTNENIGKDFVVEANGKTNGTVDISTHPEEINPNYDFRVDHQGRRFRIEEQYVFRILVTANFNF